MSHSEQTSAEMFFTVAIHVHGLTPCRSQFALAAQEDPMCPACMESAALMAGTLVSTGGLTGLIVQVFHSKKNAKLLRIEECKSKEK